ncbi:TIP41-domain-containing protein [Rhodotorula sp. JG-1b]|nr:TIP41-domain-containing protein [Rhodotorula sp. JG-1b]
MPRHRLHDDPSRGQRQIALEGWTITTTKKPILSIPEADAASNQLDLVLPEICFGNNALRVLHDETGFALEWNTIDSLRAVQRGQGWDTRPGAGPVRVAYADEWTRAQIATGSSTNLTVQKPFDWTYTTLHPGSTSTSDSSTGEHPPEWRPAPPTHPGIPLASLARTDIPILFFDEVPLFEDELGDNGIANATVRVRVNHESFFILARFALRIDNVLFRHFDVRVYHAFGSNEILREIKGREAPYDLLKQRLQQQQYPTGRRAGTGTALRSTAGSGTSAPSTTMPTIPSRTGYSIAAPSSSSSSSSSPFRNGPVSSSGSPHPPEPTEDLTPLTDSNWVAGVLEELALAEEMQNGLSVGGGAPRGDSQDPKAWEGKGRKLEVLEIPVASRTT